MISEASAKGFRAGPHTKNLPYWPPDRPASNLEAMIDYPTSVRRIDPSAEGIDGLHERQVGSFAVAGGMEASDVRLAQPPIGDQQPNV